MAFSPALAQKLEDALGSSQRVDQLAKRTELFARGGISAQNYWSTLKDVSFVLVFIAICCRSSSPGDFMAGSKRVARVAHFGVRLAAAWGGAWAFGALVLVVLLLTR